MYGGENQEDGRFALILVYNRERAYDKALQQLELLRAKYPQNRLVWLELGSTSLRAGRPADADRFLSEGLARFADDARPRMFGENALWFYKRGAARAALLYLVLAFGLVAGYAGIRTAAQIAKRKAA
jgi:predicted Zn-dependent protease